jgi:hypothetical protein
MSDSPSDRTPARGRGRFLRLFEIDARSLAAFRISLGILLLCDVLKRSLSLEAHYTDAGMLPRRALFEFLPDPTIFQAYLWSGSTGYVAALFCLAGLLALMVTVGFHARLATWLYLWLQVSVRLRNPMACHTGDVYLTVITFFAAFLPYSHVLSLDRWLHPRMPRLPRAWLAWAGAAMLLQVAAFYVGAGLDKHHFEVWTSGEAVAWFSRLGMYTTDLGARLEDYPGLCRFATYFTLVLEIGGPIALFVPWGTPWIRIVVVALLIGFHLGIQAVVHIGLFELTSIAAALVYLPAEFWDRLERLRPAAWLKRRLAPFARADESAPFLRPNVVSEVIAVLAISLVLYSNAWAATTRRAAPFPPGTVRAFLRSLELRQNWQIFSELDQPTLGWFLAIGRRSDGSLVNLWTGEPFAGNYARPANFANDFPNHNWRRVWNLVRFDSYVDIRPHLADYLLRHWNEGHADQVEQVLILEVEEGVGDKDVAGRRPLIDYLPARGTRAATWYVHPYRFRATIAR